DRARVLRWAHLPRSRSHPRAARRHHQEPDPHRADASARTARRPGNRRVMDRELTPDEITELLPAYALDAVDDDERAAIDEYLASHPDERDQVAELQVAASLLAHAGGPPPEGVWERLETII